jgi:uncharacterized protein (DUF697 family)
LPAGEGVAELVQRVAAALPEPLTDAFVARQQADVAVKERRIRALIYSKATLCAAVGLVPIPVADFFVITPIQIAMVTAIGYFHGVEVGRERVAELLSTLGVGVGLREVARHVVRLVPGYGSAVSAAIAFSGTVALGEAANLWFRGQMKLSGAELRRFFGQVAVRAREGYSRHRQRAASLAERLRRLQQRRGEDRPLDALEVDEALERPEERDESAAPPGGGGGGPEGAERAAGSGEEGEGGGEEPPDSEDPEGSGGSAR